MTQMWMIRADGGSLYDEFRDRGIAAIGWSDLAKHEISGLSRQQLTQLNQKVEPNLRPGAVISGASQVWRFINEVKPDDFVTTYSPANRTYMIGKITGPYEYMPDLAEAGLAQTRRVEWMQNELNRDDLSAATKNSLGSTLTVFKVPEFACREMLSIAAGSPVASPAIESIGDEQEVVNPLAGIEIASIEQIKDLVSKLGWEEMQELVAGILRAMGYKTQVSPAGPDRGRDIIASPDGFGFENPRIIVEVKHRKGQMGSQDIRSFLGGRHKDDRGLYVSSGGFTKDAYYEADRASVPLTLWTLDNLVRALVDNYDNTDTETKRLVPLKRMYIPA
jgi:restriction system protein